VAPYVVDNNRCISYLTIEHRGVIPRALRPLMGAWVFGCDLCQEVCPPNQRPGASAHDEFRAGAADDAASLAAPELIPLLEISPDEFTRRFGHTPVKRAKREGLQRNAAIALGNSGDRAAVPALARALREATPLVRAHTAWALGRLGGAEALAALRAAQESEADETVCEEIASALTAICA
jgi:epoxyqueuosine reductase